jgi:hypothetical protein
MQPVAIGISSAANVRFGSWSCKNVWREAQDQRLSATETYVFFEFYALIAAISGWMPMMFMTRVRL